MVKKTFIDIMMGSFGVCMYIHNGKQISKRMFDLYHSMSGPTSKSHLTYRLMRSLRDMVAHLKRKELAEAIIRVVYSGEYTFLEPIHYEYTFDAPTIITKETRKSVVREIITHHSDDVVDEHSICGYILNAISTRGFQYDEDERVTEATFHGIIAYCDRSLRVWVDRTLYLAGAHPEHIHHRAQSIMVPDVLVEMLLAKSKGSVVVYELGALSSFSTLWKQEGVQASALSRVGMNNLLTPEGQAYLIEDIKSWCKEPKGSIEVIFMMDSAFYGQISDELDIVMHKVQHLCPTYTFGAIVYALDYANPEDVYRIFSKVYNSDVLENTSQ